MAKREEVLVLDFGSQYSQLIARRIRELGVYCEIVRHDLPAERLRQAGPMGLVLSGGPASVYAPNAATTPTGIDAIEWARRVERLGAGEILLTSIDADGHKAGYDCELTARVADAVSIPVIASGGAGGPEDIYRALTDGEADAALAASIFHYGQYSIREVKDYLRQRGVHVRT